jgi:hypothetical protein
MQDWTDDIDEEIAALVAEYDQMSLDDPQIRAAGRAIYEAAKATPLPRWHPGWSRIIADSADRKTVDQTADVAALLDDNREADDG